MVNHGGLPPSPDRALLDAWRAAVLAYRRAMWRTSDDTSAYHAALDAYRAARPDEDLESARRSVSRAIAYASAYHTEWFWRCIRR